MTKKKSTDDLFEELQKKKTNINDFVKTNKESFIQVNLKEFWTELFEKSGKSKADIVNGSDISYIYFYEILEGKKVPSKDKIIRLALAMELSLDECQNALRFCNQSQLYPRIKRDSYIIYAIDNRLSVYELQELLLDAGEAELK